MERMGRLTLLLSIISEFLVSLFFPPPLLLFVFVRNPYRSSVSAMSLCTVHVMVSSAVIHCGMIISDHFLLGIPIISSNPFADTQSRVTPFEDSHLPILSFHHPYPPSINPTGSILSTSLYKPALIIPATKQLIETNTLVYSLLPTSP